MVVVVHSCAKWVLCSWAAVRLGRPFLPINPAIISRASKLQHFLRALERIGMLVVNDESIVKMLSGNTLAEVHNTSIKLILGSAGMTGWTTSDDAFAISKLSKHRQASGHTRPTARKRATRE